MQKLLPKISNFNRRFPKLQLPEFPDSLVDYHLRSLMKGLVEHAKEDFQVLMADFSVVAHDFLRKGKEKKWLLKLHGFFLAP